MSHVNKIGIHLRCYTYFLRILLDLLTSRWLWRVCSRHSTIFELLRHRQVAHLERRLMEAAKLGFTRIVTPVAPRGPAAAAFNKTVARLTSKGVEVVPCGTVQLAIEAMLGEKLRRRSARRAGDVEDDDNG